MGEQSLTLYAVKLEALNIGVSVKGLVVGEAVKVVALDWVDGDNVEVTYRTVSGQLLGEVLARDRESDLELVADRDRSWQFNDDGSRFRRVAEAQRIQWAHLFDPLLAVHTSLVEPLPHQILAVYGIMLARQPLRFLLADDPGAGKTIMAGLLIRELLVRGDVKRCLIVCPGSLSVQWQDELSQKFHLPFEILTLDRIEAARSGNIFTELPLLVVQLDQLSRSDRLQALLDRTEWDLVVVDEAHKMSASFFGGEVKETKRFKLGKRLSNLTRHFLLMTATPHNGKETDFQLFLSLLDPDRFESRFREGVESVDTSDVMRRLVKEDLLKFDGCPLFLERLAHTIAYRLSSLETRLYDATTDYVREEFNRADALVNSGRKGNVGFALTILQRRLASSPEAIYQSLRRRRERLQTRIKEERNWQEIEVAASVNSADWDDDFDDIPSEEREAIEEQVLDRATAARTIVELQAEIDRLQELERLALRVKRSGKDRKWEELSMLLQDRPEMFDRSGARRKLVVFTEHRDTLNYLVDRIGRMLGRPEAVVAIHGGVRREERKRIEEAFKYDRTVDVLVATDAAGEGINLQRAHLMVNYDLPWNPNRLEQRFGRIHRIGQTEVCHLWNLVAADTREGKVYETLLKKLEAEGQALQGKVFDVLGKAIAGKELRELLIEAIRYGDRPNVRAKLDRVVADRLDRDRLESLIDERALAHTVMDLSQVQKIRVEMERAMVRRLQPYFIASFFLEAFEYLGGVYRRREGKRYEIKRVPPNVQQVGETLGGREPILPRYERVCFDKAEIQRPGDPPAVFLCPGHPLLDATIAVLLDRDRHVLQQGAILVDETDFSDEVRVLVSLNHAIQDGQFDRSGQRRTVSRRMQYVEVAPLRMSDLQECPAGTAARLEPIDLGAASVRPAGYAPYLDYRPIASEERALFERELFQEKSGQQGIVVGLQTAIERETRRYAVLHLAKAHLQEVKQQREALIDKTIVAVKSRLTQEIQYWDRRSAELLDQERVGKPNARINSSKAGERADELQSRMEARLAELERERQLASGSPVISGAALIVPIGLLHQLAGTLDAATIADAKARKRIERAAIEAVMAIERSLGHVPNDVGAEKRGYDIESFDPETGRTWFLEVKGKYLEAETVTVTRNEIINSLNAADRSILALVKVPPEGSDASCAVRYVRNAFERELSRDEVSTNFSLARLWDRGEDVGMAGER
jgi:SNF2 family DNA or RNA helicase